MSNPAFFVDGQTEQRSLHKLCPGNPIRIIGCNGHTVSIEAIAKRLATLIRVLNNKYHPIVVLIDREGRDENIEQIKGSLLKELMNLGVKDKVLVGVCDRMIENWILSDQENFQKYIGKKVDAPSSTWDGVAGKPIVKKHFPVYHETTDGVSLLTSSNPKKLYSTSPSFRHFVSGIAEINCEWLADLNG